MEIHALLVIEFEDSADRISREMFIERLASFGWQRNPSVPSAWTLEFDERTSPQSALRTVNNHLDLACERGRVTRAQVRAVVELGPQAPIQV